MKDTRHDHIEVVQPHITHQHQEITGFSETEQQTMNQSTYE